MSHSSYVPQTFPHIWLPERVNLTTWDRIQPWYQELVETSISSTVELEVWLTQLGEINGAVSQEGVKRYVAMTCQTDDSACEASYLEWVRDVEPMLKPIQNALREKYLDSPHRAGLSKSRYHVFDRAWENRRALYREANVARETELAELEQQYQKLIGAMMVMYKGEERTPAQMSPLLEEIDRAQREEVWKLVAARRLQDKDKLDELFDQMIVLREAIAKESGFADYVAYAYRSRERFDYGVAEAEAFQKAIETVVVPLVRDIQESRLKTLGIDRLRPWDLSVDPLNRQPLRPFTDVEALAKGTETVFNAVDPELGSQFAYLHANGLLDLANRKGKAPGGYQTTYEDDRLPFIFMNAVGVDGDVRTLLHEGGHAFHALAARAEPLAAYRETPIEFCEVASMTMELFGGPELGVFYNEDDARRSYQQLLEGIVVILPWIATVDAFQHWVYQHPGHTRSERRDAWNAILNRFGGSVDWTGYEEARSHSWHRQLHIFLYPFYYIEYGIAQLGALGLWHRSLSDKPGAVAAYRKALALGGSKPLPELFGAAGLPFDFSEATLRPLIDSIRAELEKVGP